MEKILFLLAILLHQVLKNEASSSSFLLSASSSSNFNTNFGFDVGITKGDAPLTTGPIIPTPLANPSPAQHPATFSDQTPPPAEHPGTISDQNPPPVSAPAQHPATSSDQNPLLVSAPEENPPPVSSPAKNPPMSGAEFALQTWKSAITDDPLHFLDNWVGPDVCSYKGIFCYQENESSPPTIASIDLNNANLQGTLVKELSFFKNMTIFHLNSNRFTGKIPESFEELPCLEELDLSNNNFSGPFPAVALCIPKLAYLDLRFNCFSGPIPEALFDKKLDAIFINNNNFDGLIPQNLGNAVASVINFANNRLTGSLPTNFGQFGCKINEIVLLNNQLTGCMPPGIGLFPDLEVFDVGQNSFTGQIPDTLARLTKIQVLNLGNNKFSGQMPDFCAIKSLLNLTVSNNFFSGFGSDCSKLLNSKLGFNFSLNCAHGSIWGTPRSQCSLIPGESLNCLRLPIPEPLACAVHGLVPGGLVRGVL